MYLTGPGITWKPASMSGHHCGFCAWPTVGGRSTYNKLVSLFEAGSLRKYSLVLPPVFLNVRQEGVLSPLLEKWDLTSRTVCLSSDQVGGEDTSIRDITILHYNPCIGVSTCWLHVWTALANLAARTAVMINLPALSIYHLHLGILLSEINNVRSHSLNTHSIISFRAKSVSHTGKLAPNISHIEQTDRHIKMLNRLRNIYKSYSNWVPIITSKVSYWVILYITKQDWNIWYIMISIFVLWITQYHYFYQNTN